MDNEMVKNGDEEMTSGTRNALDCVNLMCTPCALFSHKNPTLEELNMRWIRSHITEIWPFEIFNKFLGFGPSGSSSV